jgi:Arc/MetJ-type ribon-helix-helix transcriptional regulator
MLHGRRIILTAAGWPSRYTGSRIGMEIHLDSRSEELIQRQLRSGRYHSAEQVVASALEALAEDTYPRTEDERRQAVQDMLAFAEKHRLTLGEGVRIRDLIHEGHKY